MVNRDDFQQSAQALTGKIKVAGARPVFYMTWGYRDGENVDHPSYLTFSSMNDDMCTSYASVAAQTNAVVLPVGRAWNLAYKRNPKLWQELYSSDGKHPGIKGAYLAAHVFYRVFFAGEFPAFKLSPPLSKSEEQTLRQAAIDAVNQ